MSESILGALVFLKLAEISQARQQFNQRDKFLILAGHASWECGKRGWAECVRRMVVEQHPHHLLKHFKDWETAEDDAEFQAFLKQLVKFCSRERGELFLEQWQIDLDAISRERDVTLEFLGDEILQSMLENKEAP
ncbi:MAG: hypothetical protein U0903_17845 [Planctomycetales bacterium]